MSCRFSIKSYHGAMTLFRDGIALQPLFFWQSEVLPEEATAFSQSGIEVFSFLRSAHHYDYPFWIGEKKYDFSKLDSVMHEFIRNAPGKYAIPRIYTGAPDWWLSKHPDEMCGFASNPPRTGYKAVHQGTRHESFASELWKCEMGEAFRQYMRHIRNSDYAEWIAGIHVCGGITGEWHAWSPSHHPDTSLPMQKRYGKEIPAYGKRPADYYECFFAAEVEAVEHFCKIVKEETDFLTVVFQGYTPDFEWAMEGDHRGAAAIHRSPWIDMISAPHSYSRRELGGDALFRNFPASVNLHGKLFVDEGDDRTSCAGSISHGMTETAGVQKTLATEDESLQLIRREFGNMHTHNIGMWYMDLLGGTFRNKRFVAEIAKLKKYGDQLMELSRESAAEVAVVSYLQGEFSLPPRGEENLQYRLYQDAISELCKTGVPFDHYLIEDLNAPELVQYKFFIYLDGLPLPERYEKTFAKLAAAGKTVLRFDARNILPAKELREQFRANGISVYLETDDVFSCSQACLMIHATKSGVKQIALPKKKNVFDIITEKTIAENTDHFSIEMKFGETALFLLR